MAFNNILKTGEHLKVYENCTSKVRKQFLISKCTIILFEVLCILDQTAMRNILKGSREK